MDKSSLEYKRQYQREYHRKRRGSPPDLEYAINLTVRAMEAGAKQEREKVVKRLEDILSRVNVREYMYAYIDELHIT